jgi:hypothetical protein
MAAKDAAKNGRETAGRRSAVPGADIAHAMQGIIRDASSDYTFDPVSLSSRLSASASACDAVIDVLGKLKGTTNCEGHTSS